MEDRKLLQDFEEQVGFRKSRRRIKIIPRGQYGESEILLPDVPWK